MPNNSTVQQRVSTFIKEYIKDTGTKQYFIAEQMGYNPKKFSELLNCRALMQIEDIETICNYFGVPATLFIPLNQGQKGA